MSKAPHHQINQFKVYIMLRHSETMRKLILVVFLSCMGLSGICQRFSQYNTGTLYESFENPAQGIFKTDTSRQFAFNFFVPNTGTSSYVKGNAQYALKSRLFLDRYNTDVLEIGAGKMNSAVVNSNTYALMFKVYTSINGEQQIGISAQTKVTGYGDITDETLALFGGFARFDQNTYSNVFNNRAFYEGYHQISATYREQVNKQLSLGVKLSGLLGIAYNKIDITNSRIDFDRAGDKATWALSGVYRSSFEPGVFGPDDLRPSFQNPGLAVSMGFVYKTSDNIVVQGNIKDLGFIHWADESRTYNFNGSTTINNLSQGNSESKTINALSSLVQRAPVNKSFTAPIVGRAEVAGSKKFLFEQISYTPTLIASAQLFGKIYTGALVNHVQYRNFVATVTGTYDSNNIASFGGQLMYRSPNAEFFIGSEQLRQNLNMISASRNGGNITAINKDISHSGADIFFGFSAKFGNILEHPMNASHIPMGEEPNFLGRLWNRLFKKSER